MSGLLYNGQKNTLLSLFPRKWGSFSDMIINTHKITDLVEGRCYFQNGHRPSIEEILVNCLVFVACYISRNWFKKGASDLYY